MAERSLGAGVEGGAAASALFRWRLGGGVAVVVVAEVFVVQAGGCRSGGRR